MQHFKINDGWITKVVDAQLNTPHYFKKSAIITHLMEFCGREWMH